MGYSNRRILVCISKVILIITSIICTSLFILSVHNIATGADKQPEGIVIQYDGYLSPHNAWEYTSHVKAYKEHLEENRDILCKKSETCELLAKTVLYEARGESVEGQRLVAEVVINRVNDDKFPDTVKGVVYQKHQFSFVADMHKQRNPSEKSLAIARKVAYDAINGKKTRKNNFLWYHSNKVSPSWSKGKKGVKVGNHIFYDTL